MYAVVQPCCIYFDVSKYGGITSYDITFCVGFFQNDDNQVNIGLLWLGLVSYHTIHHIIHVYGENSAQSPRRMFTTACSFASHFRQQMAQNADLPSESCKNFSGVIPPNPCPVLGHRAVLYRDSRCFGSHNFQIVPAHLLAIVTTQTRRFFHSWHLCSFERPP